MEYSILSDNNKFKQWKDEVGSYMNILGVNEYTEKLTVEGENLEGKICIKKSLDSIGVYAEFESGSAKELHIKTDEASVEFGRDVHIESLYVEEEAEYIKISSYCPGIVDKMHIYNINSLVLSSIGVRELHIHMNEKFYIETDFGYCFVKMFKSSVTTQLFIYYCIDTVVTGITRSRIDEIYKIGNIRIDKTVQLVWLRSGKVEIHKGYKIYTLYTNTLSKKDIQNLYRLLDNYLRGLLKQININLVTFIHG